MAIAKNIPMHELMCFLVVWLQKNSLNCLFYTNCFNKSASKEFIWRFDLFSGDQLYGELLWKLGLEKWAWYFRKTV